MSDVIVMPVSSAVHAKDTFVQCTRSRLYYVACVPVCFKIDSIILQFDTSKKILESVRELWMNSLVKTDFFLLK